MNPSKMRNTYGKLIYLLQGTLLWFYLLVHFSNYVDSAIPEVQQLLNFSCVKPMQTVYSLLEGKGALDLLSDPLISIATGEILSEGKSRRSIQSEIKAKERAVNILSDKYEKSSQLSEESIKNVLYSIGDNHAFLRGSRDRVDEMIKYLKAYFDPSDRSKGDLSISQGSNGARLVWLFSIQSTEIYNFN
jgi:hypothetical protein